MTRPERDVPLIEEIRAKLPGLAAKADAGNVLAAVRLGCIECCGGSRAMADSCSSAICALHPYRRGRNPYRQRQLTDEQRAAMAERLRAARAAGQAAPDDDCDDDLAEEIEREETPC